MGSHEFRGAFANDLEVALRPLGWGELCARLVAAQDYRRTLAALPTEKQVAQQRVVAVSGASPGSFHSGTAHMLEHFDKGNRGVNPTSSSYGKDSQGTPVDSRQTSLSAFAERQADENSHD